MTPSRNSRRDVLSSHMGPPQRKTPPGADASGHQSHPLPSDRLTDAELRILRYLATYRSLRQIADECFVAHSTVKTHSLSVYRKLQVRTRAEAVRKAIQLGLIPDERFLTGDTDAGPT
jgi:DNA-binding CsgD family transcriptional regulator